MALFSAILLVLIFLWSPFFAVETEALVIRKSLQQAKPNQPTQNNILKTLKVSTMVKRSGAEDSTKLAAAEIAEAPAPASFMDNAKLAIYLVLWYLISAYYNIYNKKALNELSMPWFVATVQMGMGVFIFVPLWLLNIRKKPFASMSELGDVLWNSKSVALFMTLSHIAGVSALGSGAVSFTQVVKAAEPAFTAFLSAVTIRQFLPWQSYAALIPVIGGVSLASVSELNFSWFCFAAGVTSNIFAAARSVFGKVQMKSQIKSLQNISSDNYYSLLTILSFIMLVPVTFFAEGSKILELVRAADGANSLYGEGMKCAFISGLMFYLYNELSFRVLSKVNAVSHALANTVKRIVIILSSVLFFRNTLTANGQIGSTMAIGGVFLYSISQAIYKK